MSIEIIAMVLLGAMLHASWNLLAKINAGRAGDAVVVGIAAGIPAAIAIPWTGLPNPAAWPQVVASAVIHIAYFRVLAGAYRGGDLSVAYPLMRGVPPLLVCFLSAALFGEILSLLSWMGVLILVFGILSLGLEGLRRGALRGGSARFVAMQIGIIVTYTLVDASGVRASGNPFAYIAWQFALTAVVLVPFARDSLRPFSSAGWQPRLVVLAGGTFTVGSYGIALWAMTHAPVAMVAALRETSILFGAAFGAVFLGERFGARRWIAVALVLVGIVTLRLA